MTSKSVIHIIIISILLISISACGGADSNVNGNNSNPEPPTVIDGKCVDNPPQITIDKEYSSFIQTDQSLCLGFKAKEGSSYKITLKSLTAEGDADIAVHLHHTFDSNSVLAYAINDAGILDEIIITAPYTQEYYIETYGFTQTEYVILIEEINNIDNFLTLSINQINYSLFSSSNIPVNQKILQDNSITESVVFIDFQPNQSWVEPTVLFSIDNQINQWSNVEIKTGDYANPMSIGINIQDTRIPAGLYNDRIRVYLSPDHSISVFKDINVIIDSKEPPLNITSTPNSEAEFNTLFSSKVEAVDKNNNPITFNRLYGPNGLEIDSMGNINWLPNTPLFNQKMDFNWGSIVSTQEISIEVAGIITVNSNNFTQPTVRTGIALPEFSNGYMFAMGDTNNDNKNEIIVTNAGLTYAMGNILYTLVNAGSKYEEEWVDGYNFHIGKNISSVAVADLNKDGFDDIIIATALKSGVYEPTNNNNLYIIDGKTKELVKEHYIETKHLSIVDVKDIDNDSKPEIIAVIKDAYTSQLVIYDSTVMVEKWRYVLQSSFSQIFIANVDSDPAHELIIRNNSFDENIVVIDGYTYNKDLTFNIGIDTNIFVGDADNDGKDDLIVTTLDNLLIYSLTDGTNTYSIPTPASNNYGDHIFNVVVLDYDGDGKNEILGLMDIYPNSRIYAYKHNENLGDFESRGVLVTTLDVFTSKIFTLKGDFDNDGKEEALISTGGFSTGTDGLIVIGFDTLSSSLITEWITNNPSEITGYAGSDGISGAKWVKTGFGTGKIVTAIPNSSEIDSSSYSEFNRLITVDPLNGKTNFSSPLSNTYCNGDLPVFETTNIAADGTDDVILPSCNGLNVVNFDLLQDTIAWTNYIDTDMGSAVASDSKDLNNDGAKDIAYATKNGFVYVYDAATQSIIWKSDKLGISASDLKLSDLNSDGEYELIVIITKILNDIQQKHLIVFKYDNINSKYNIQKIILLDNAENIAVSDLDGDDVPEIIVSSYAYGKNVEIHIFNKDLVPIKHHIISDTNWITGISSLPVYVEELPGQKKNLVLFYNKTIKDEFYMEAIDPYSGGGVWKSPYMLSENVKNSLGYDDIDSDGNIELFYSTKTAMYILH